MPTHRPTAEAAAFKSMEIEVSESGNLAGRLRLTNMESGGESLATPSVRA